MHAVVALLLGVLIRVVGSILCGLNECHLAAEPCTSAREPFGDCFSVPGDTVTWYVSNRDAALKICQSKGAELVAPADSATNAQMQQLCPSAAFFDLTFAVGPGDCNQVIVESTNEMAPFVNWAMGEPNNGVPRNNCSRGSLLEGCVAFIAGKTTWQDRPCTKVTTPLNANDTPACVICGQRVAGSTASGPLTVMNAADTTNTAASSISTWPVSGTVVSASSETTTAAIEVSAVMNATDATDSATPPTNTRSTSGTVVSTSASAVDSSVPSAGSDPLAIGFGAGATLLFVLVSLVVLMLWRRRRRTVAPSHQSPAPAPPLQTGASIYEDVRNVRKQNVYEAASSPLAL